MSACLPLSRSCLIIRKAYSHTTNAINGSTSSSHVDYFGSSRRPLVDIDPAAPRSALWRVRRGDPFRASLGDAPVTSQNRSDDQSPPRRPPRPADWWTI